MVREYLRHWVGFSSAARLFLAAQFLYGIGQSAVWVLRNLYLREAGLEPDRIGATLSASAFGMVVVVVLVSQFMDRMRLRGFLVTGALLLAGGLAGVTWVSHEFALLGFCFVSGVGMAMLEVSSAPFLSRNSRAAERPYLFGVSMAVSPTAGLVATLGIQLGAWAWGENLGAYRWMMWAAAACAALSVAALAGMRETAPEPGKEDEEPFEWRTAAKFCVPEMVIGLGAGLTIPFINLYFRERFGMQAGAIGLCYAAAQGLMMAAFLAAPMIARRFGPVRTIVAFQMTSVPFFFVLALTTSPAVAVGAFLLRHASMNMVHPVSANFMMDVARSRQRVRINGLKQTANKLAWVVATSAGGVLIHEVPLLVDGFTTVMFVTIFLYVAGGLLYWLFFRREPAGRVVPPAVDSAAEA